jgi:hypothetical protein
LSLSSLQLLSEPLEQNKKRKKRDRDK